MSTVRESRTVAIDGGVLRLYGREGFGSDLRAEVAARVALDGLVAGIDLHCTEAGRDRNRRLLGICRAAEIDIGEAMIGAGMALIDRAVTRDAGADAALADRYDAAEAAARRGAAGLWATVPGYEPALPPEPVPPPPGFWDRVERYQAGLAVLAGFLIVAGAMLVSGRQRRKAAAGG